LLKRSDELELEAGDEVLGDLGALAFAFEQAVVAEEATLVL